MDPYSFSDAFDNILLTLTKHQKEPLVIPENMPQGLLYEYNLQLARLEYSVSLYKIEKDTESFYFVNNSFQRYLTAFDDFSRYIEFYNTHSNQKEVL